LTLTPTFSNHEPTLDNLIPRFAKDLFLFVECELATKDILRLPPQHDSWTPNWSIEKIRPKLGRISAYSHY